MRATHTMAMAASVAALVVAAPAAFQMITSERKPPVWTPEQIADYQARRPPVELQSVTPSAPKPAEPPITAADRALADARMNELAKAAPPEVRQAIEQRMAALKRETQARERD